MLVQGEVHAAQVMNVGFWGRRVLGILLIIFQNCRLCVLRGILVATQTSLSLQHYTMLLINRLITIFGLPRYGSLQKSTLIMESIHELLIVILNILEMPFRQHMPP